jgi:hypothetical protein
MPLLSSLDRCETRLRNVLEEVVHSIEIQSNFWIHHSLHPSLELQSSVFNGLQQLPINLQDQYLRLRLGTYLSSIYDASKKTVELSNHSASAGFPHREHSAQNKAQGIDADFYKSLHTNNGGYGYFDPGWILIREASDGLSVVQKDGLTLHIGRDRHLSPTDQSAAIGETVAVRLPSNSIEDGCYVAVGNAGPVKRSEEGVQKINVYFNLGPEAVVAIMRLLTAALNDLSLSFTFKVPHEEENCDSSDSGVLNINKSDYVKVQSTLEKIYQHHQLSFRTEIPLFAKVLAPGLALSEDPLNRFTPHESFGINRYQILADGLLGAWRKGEESPEQKIFYVLQSFSDHSIDLKHPYLNPDSEDCYPLLVDSGITQ